MYTWNNFYTDRWYKKIIPKRTSVAKTNKFLNNLRIYLCTVLSTNAFKSTSPTSDLLSYRDTYQLITIFLAIVAITIMRTVRSISRFKNASPVLYHLRHPKMKLNWQITSRTHTLTHTHIDIISSDTKLGRYPNKYYKL